MMTRTHGKIQFECEGCSEVLDTDTPDFDEARETMKQENWRAYKFGEVWNHSCPECDR